MARKKKGPSEKTLIRQKEINIQLQQAKGRRESAEKERIAFSRLPAREQEARIRGAAGTGRIAVSGPATVEEKPFDKTPVTDFPDEPQKKAGPIFALSPQEAIAEKGVFGYIFGNQIVPERGPELATGTVPLGFGGGQAALLERAISQTSQQVEQTTGLAKAFGTSTAQAEAWFPKIARITTLEIFRNLTKAKWFKIGAGGLFGLSLMGNWMASDNIMTQAAITSNNVVWAVKNEAISREEGLQIIEGLQTAKDYAEGFVKVNSKINPIFWGPLGKPYLINAETTQISLDLAKRNIEMEGF